MRQNLVPLISDLLQNVRDATLLLRYGILKVFHLKMPLVIFYRLVSLLQCAPYFAIKIHYVNHTIVTGRHNQRLLGHTDELDRPDRVLMRLICRLVS